MQKSGYYGYQNIPIDRYFFTYERTGIALSDPDPKNGTPKNTGINTNGKKEGKWSEFFENGQLKSTGTYTNGAKNKDWIYYNSDGTVDTIKTK